MNGEKPLLVRVMRVGSSLAIVLPKPLREAYNLHRGDTIAFSCLEGTHFQVYPIRGLDIKEGKKATIKM